MRRTLVAAGTAALVGVLLVSGCSKSSGPDSPLRSAGGGYAAKSPAAEAAAVPAAPDAAAGNASATSLDLRDPRALIRTADLQVTVARGTSVSAQADRATAIVAAVGGEVFSDNRTAGENATASMTLKVPPQELTGVLGRLAALGEEKSRQVSTRDVTTEVADVASRVESAQRSIERLRALYDKATKVSDIIAIESELGRREADLESLQAQQRALSSQVSMATVQLTLTTAPTKPATHHDKGFLGGLRNGWDHFTSSANWVATALGAAVPFLVLALLIAGGIALLLRHRPRPSPPSPPASAGPAV